MSRLHSSRGSAQPSIQQTPGQPTRSGPFFHASADGAIGAFHDFIHDRDFPCVAAKSALATDGIRFVVAGDLRDRDADRTILAALLALPTPSEETTQFVSTAILFPGTPPLSEIAFEKHLWALLQSLYDMALYDLDREAFDWDRHSSSDPNADNFAMRIGGAAYFVVGMHPGASRLARQAPLAAVVFNPHSQFRRLKRDALFERLRQAIRERDVALQGDTNPMLADHGDRSEAAQYSGRQVSAGWACPFRPLGLGRRLHLR